MCGSVVCNPFPPPNLLHIHLSHPFRSILDSTENSGHRDTEKLENASERQPESLLSHVCPNGYNSGSAFTFVRSKCTCRWCDDVQHNDNQSTITITISAATTTAKTVLRHSCGAVKLPTNEAKHHPSLKMSAALPLPSKARYPLRKPQQSRDALNSTASGCCWYIVTTTTTANLTNTTTILAQTKRSHGDDGEHFPIMTVYAENCNVGNSHSQPSAILLPKNDSPLSTA